jgi:hypothetical protein
MKMQSIPVLAAAALVSACVSLPERPPMQSDVPPPVNLTKVFFYPAQGQSEEQQDRDRYDCHVWSVRQTRFDPSLHLAAGEERSAVIPARSPGSTIGAAAAVGAVIGAIAAGPGDTFEGALVGGMAGTVMGSAAASAEAAEVRRVERSRNLRAAGRYEKESAAFRRAMSACLEGRGYTVK